MRKSKGMALIASMVIVLIVSIVAIAIASTAASNRVASFSTYDTTSSYANSQAGINLGEVILMTATTDELSDLPEFRDGGQPGGVPDGKVGRKVSTDCASSTSYSNAKSMLAGANDCFWWIGLSNGYLDKPGFMSVLGSAYYDSDEYPKAETMFKLEERSEIRTRSLESGDKLGRKFYRITSIGHGNTDGLSKIQGQIGVYTVIDINPEVDENAAEY